MTDRPFPVADVLSFLAGRWQVERTVRDLATGRHGRFDGSADFRPADGGDGLLHQESGTFVFGGVGRPARRAHRFVAAGDGTARVLFEDGRPFHDLDLRSGRWEARHPCAADAYLGRFDVLGADRWQVVWEVSGPAKNLLLTTVHVRHRGT